MSSSPIQYIGSRDFHRDLPKVLNSLEDSSARTVLTVHGKPKAVLLGAEAFLELLRGVSKADRLLAMQLGVYVEATQAMESIEEGPRIDPIDQSDRLSMQN